MPVSGDAIKAGWIAALIDVAKQLDIRENANLQDLEIIEEPATATAADVAQLLNDLILVLQDKVV